MKRLLTILLATESLFLSSCMSASSLADGLDAESRSFRGVIREETAKTNKLHAERRQLESRLGIAQNREAKLTAGGVKPDEEAELSKVRQDIASLKKQLSALAAAG